ncbi:MAG: replication-relaxation family protein [Planctomycetaceae bacterium]
MSRGRSKGLAIQSRDIAILKGLGLASCLTSDSIRERWFPGDKTGEATRRRLQRFAEQGLTQRVAISVSRINQPGRMPLVHRLLPLGADVVEDETGIRPLRVAKSDPPKPYTLLHRAGMGEIVLRFNEACALHNLPEPQWLLEYDTIPGTPPNAPLSRRYLTRWDVPISKDETSVCWPDALCLFTLPTPTRTWHLAIAWEYDRSTETHSQFARKLPAYQSWLEHRLYKQLFPTVDDARIFVVVKTDERLSHLVATIKEHPASDLVRLTTHDACRPTDMLSESIWRYCDGQTRAILSFR